MISSADFIAKVIQAFTSKVLITLSPANTPAEQATGIQLELLADDNNAADPLFVLSPENGNISDDELGSAVTWLKQVANPADPREQEAIGTLSTFVRERGDASKLLKDLGLQEVPLDNQLSGLFTAAGSQVGEIQGGEKASQGEVIDSVMDAVSEQWVAEKRPAAVPASFSRQGALIADARMESQMGIFGKTLQDDQKLASDIKKELNKDTVGRLYSAVLERTLDSSQPSLRVADLPSMLKEAGIPEPNVIANRGIFGSGKLQVLSGEKVLAVIPYNSNKQSIEVKGATQLRDQLGDLVDKLSKAQPVFQEAEKRRDSVESFVDNRWSDPWEDPTSTESTDPPPADRGVPETTDQE